MPAYQNIHASQGNMTQGTDGKTIDAMSLSRIDGIIVSLKDESYQPRPIKKDLHSQEEWENAPVGHPIV